MKALLVAAAVVGLAGSAHGEETGPWTHDVDRATQTRANKSFAAANELFAQQAHSAAATRYREALALWDHPLIRFNLAVTLIRLERIVEAADELDRSLRFGQAPFPKETYRQALDYQALLKGRVGDLEASCSQDNVHVLLDGKPWFSCPGTRNVRILAGPHAVAGERDGYVTSSERAIVVGGERSKVDLTLVAIDAAVRVNYRFPRWIPWTVAGTGTAVALAGIGVWLVGRTRMDQFGTDLATTCPDGCDLAGHPGLADARARARSEGTIGVALMSAGAVTVVAGVVMAVLNRPRRTLPVEVVPTDGGAAAIVRGRFF